MRLKDSDFFLLGLLILTIPLFFYKLGNSSLSSWDEAWYAEISRNVLISHNPIYLTFNGDPYVDHPPLGFWLESLSFMILGVSEFSARFISALSGFSTLLVLFLLGKVLFNRVVGLLSAAALLSAPWFLYRARSGNLDSLLTILFLLTLLLGFQAAKKKQFIVPFSFSLVGLFLTKTLIPITIIPSLLIIFWKTKIQKKNLFLPIIFLSVFFGGWFFLQSIHKDDFVTRFFFIGFPPPEKQASTMENIQFTKLLIHNGLGKWFWPSLFSLFASIFLFQKRFLLLTTFFCCFIFPFLLSSRGGIWHLIPLYPIMILSFVGFFYVILEKAVKPFQNETIKKLLVILPIGLIVGYYSYLQTRANWYQFIDISPQISAEVPLLKQARSYQQNFYIDGEDIVPMAVFYSGKNTSKVWEGRVKEMFSSPEKFILLTKQERLDRLEVSKNKYQIVGESQDYILVRKEN